MPSPPSPLYLLTGIGMIAVAVVSVGFWKRGRAVSWTAFGLGALAWVVSVALKIAWAVPTNQWMRDSVYAALPRWAAGPVFWLYIGLLTGVFEGGITFLFVKRTRLREASWDEAVAFGVGFGAVEALLLGLPALILQLVAFFFWNQLPADVKTPLEESLQFGLAAIPLPVIERISALFIHILVCTLIVYRVRVGARRWFWLAFVYKSVIDAFAAWFILGSGMSKTLAGLVEFEAAAVAYAMLGLAGLAFLKSRFQSLTAPGLATPTDVESQGMD